MSEHTILQHLLFRPIAKYSMKKKNLLLYINCPYINIFLFCSEWVNTLFYNIFCLGLLQNSLWMPTIHHCNRISGSIGQFLLVGQGKEDVKHNFGIFYSWIKFLVVFRVTIFWLSYFSQYSTFHQFTIQRL